MADPQIPQERLQVVLARPGGGGPCHAMVRRAQCTNAARWEVVSSDGRAVPSCRLHANKAVRAGELKVRRG
jgi:hypothetical protein